MREKKCRNEHKIDSIIPLFSFLFVVHFLICIGRKSIRFSPNVQKCIKIIHTTKKNGK